MKKSGAWVSYNNEKIANGRDKAIQYLKDNQEVADEINNKILESLSKKN